METIADSSLEWMKVVSGGKASKKLITDAGDIEFPSSAHVVISNDDLLIEILLRLPVFSLLLFKSVSKRWFSLITDLTFTRSQIRNVDSPCGLYLQRHSYTVEYDFVPFDIRIPPNRSPFPTSFTFRVDAGNVEILQSCNGLFLCFIGPPNQLYVYNPSINNIKMLPQGPYSDYKSYIGRSLRLGFDPTKSPHYKLVYAGSEPIYEYDAIQIHTYSSETCNWSVSGDRFSRHCFNGFGHGIYWNDAIHWLDFNKWALHYKLDVEHLVLTTIQTPIARDGKVFCYKKLFESHGCLLLVCKDDLNSRELTVFEMRNGYSGWSVKSLVNLDDIIMLIPETWKMSSKQLCFNVLSIVVGEKEDDLFLVMEAFGKVVKYKIVLKTVLMLYDLGSIYPPVMKPSSFHSFPFIASFAGV